MGNLSIVRNVEYGGRAMSEKQICKNVPGCFGDIAFEKRENDCEQCPFFAPCDKVGNAVAYYKMRTKKELDLHAQCMLVDKHYPDLELGNLLASAQEKEGER